MEASRKRLRQIQLLLRNILRLDLADLELGLGRLLWLKRNDVEAFIDEQLPRKAIEAFHSEFGGQVLEALRAYVYNHLYRFFSHHYENGDFLVRPCAYKCIDEETPSYWASGEIHYIRAGSPRDYSFEVEANGGARYRISFTIDYAERRAGGVGDLRYLFPLPEASRFDPRSCVFKLPFHHRLPFKAELEGCPDGFDLQRAVFAEAVPRIFAAIHDPNVKAALASSLEGADGRVCMLLKRLHHFAHRHTTGYFVPRDLPGLLKRELDFYLKDQALDIDDLEGDFGWKRQALCVIRRLAEEIIAFLGQIEDVKKRVFEKPKLVLRTDYLVSLRCVPRELWQEIVANERQLRAWGALFAVEHGDAMSYMENHPTLVVDTSHFPQRFKDRFLASFENLDEVTDGLLVHGENYQALTVLLAKYAEQVKFLYVDPPYNTGTDSFAYKDRYRHSTWVAMMAERLRLARLFLAGDGVAFSSIGVDEFPNMKKLMDWCFGAGNFVGDVVWKNEIGNSPTRIAIEHEYLVCSAKDLKSLPAEWKSSYCPSKELLLSWYNRLRSRGLTVAQIQEEYQDFIRKNSPALSPLQQYRLIDVEEPFAKSDPVAGLTQLEGHEAKYLQEDFASFRSVVILDQELGMVTLSGLFGTDRFALQYPNPVEHVEYLLSFATGMGNTVLDITGGSGTTGHAVIALNRRDGLGRKFILIEVSDHFDSIILPRIQKVMYAPEWSDGRPSRAPTTVEVERSPRLVKVLQIETYDDRLNRLSAPSTLRLAEQMEESLRTQMGADGYRTCHLLTTPLEASEKRLNETALKHPVDCALEVVTEEGTRQESVDVIETFNLLYGLRVERIEIWSNPYDERDYHVVSGRDQNGEHMLVLWRDIEGLDLVAESRFLESELARAGPFDQVLINGSTLAPGVRSLDELFVQLLTQV